MGLLYVNGCTVIRLVNIDYWINIDNGMICKYVIYTIESLFQIGQNLYTWILTSY